MEKKDVFIGMKLYRESTGKFDKGEITEYTVKSIGNKYLECQGLYDRKIRIDNLRYEDKIYTQHNFQMYLNKQDILDRREIGKLSSHIRATIGSWGTIDYPLETLRKIAELLIKTPTNETI